MLPEVRVGSRAMLPIQLCLFCLFGFSNFFILGLQEELVGPGGNQYIGLIATGSYKQVSNRGVTCFYLVPPAPEAEGLDEDREPCRVCGSQNHCCLGITCV